MASSSLRLLILLFYLLASDDAAVMTKFAAAISPVPASWSGTDFCKCSGVGCDSDGLPSNLNSLSHLSTLSLQGNSFSGELPSFSELSIDVIGGMNQLAQVWLQGPDLQFAPSLTALPNLLNVSLQNNKLQGNDACNQWPFVRCDASGNVTSISLAKQHLNGSISPALADLEYLNLNANYFTAPIPENLTTLASLQVLDVSYKEPAFISTGTDTGGGGGSGSNSTGCSGSTSKKSSVSAGLVVGVVIGVLVSVGVILFGLYGCYLKRGIQKKPKELEVPQFGSDLVSEGGNVVIPIQVLRQATNNFSDDNILGQGGFGVVYGGILENGTKIAVKRMKASTIATKGLKEFEAEIGVLTKVRHRHLVALLGYCFNEDEKVLVYEYLPQGTLGHHLFRWKEFGLLPLTWKQRMIIALDVSRGVEYLHNLAQSSFIHRDLKPGNILLGNDMRAKVSDFGLVKIAPDDNHSTLTRVAGTFGYIDPAYAATGRVTTKVDVYAFGIILMELITGRKALDNSMPEENCQLVTWFRKLLMDNEDGIRDVLDDSLDTDDEAYDSILRIAELAGYCTAERRNQRPDMGHAVNVLAPLVEQWMPVTLQEEGGGDLSFGQTDFSYSSSVISVR